MYKVLIVDDEAAIQRGLAKLIPWDELGLSLAGFADNGNEALLRVREAWPDIVLTDVKMPGMDGLELIRELSALRPELRAVVISGYDEFAYVKEAMRYRVDNYLLKPIDRDELIQTLAGIAEQLDRQRKAPEAEDRLMELLLWRLFRRQIDERELMDRLAFMGMERELHPPYRLCRLISPDAEALAGARQSLARAGGAFHQRMCAPEAEHGALNWVACGFPGDGAGERLASGALQALRHNGLITFGRPVRRLIEIADSYDDAVSMGEFRLLGIRDQILWYADEPNRRTEAPKLAISPDQLLRCMETGDRAGAFREIDAAVQEILADGDPTAIAGAFMILTAGCIHHARVTNLPVEALLGSMRPFDEVRALAGQDAISYPEWLKELVRRMLDARQEARHGPRDGRILSYIHEHYQRDLSLSSLSQRFALSPAYLGTLIKAATGELFSVYLNRYRIERAKEKLAGTNESASVIGKSVGFHDANYFYKVFFKYTGCYPTAYRNRARGRP